VFNDVHDGSFDELPVSMAYLRRTYGSNFGRVERSLEAVG